MPYVLKKKTVYFRVAIITFLFFSLNFKEQAPFSYKKCSRNRQKQILYIEPLSYDNKACP